MVELRKVLTANLPLPDNAKNSQPGWSFIATR